MLKHHKIVVKMFFLKITIKKNTIFIIILFVFSLLKLTRN